MDKFVQGDKVSLTKEGLTIWSQYHANQIFIFEAYTSDNSHAHLSLENKNDSFFPVRYLMPATEPVVDTEAKPNPAIKFEPEMMTSDRSVPSLARSNDEDPQFYVMSVQFANMTSSDRKSLSHNRRYEYLAFGMYDELVAATHAVVTRHDHQDLDDLLGDEELQVVRILDVYPTSQQRFNGKLRHIVDFVDGAAFVKRNMREAKSVQLKKDLKSRLELMTQMNSLKKAVEESGDAKAAELYQQLQELEQDNG